MATQDELLLQLETIASNLVANARQLQQVSSQICTQEELTPLQEEQDSLVARLVEIDAAFHLELSGGDADPSLPVMQRIEKRLQEFQTLNNGFVANVRTHQNLIQFESELYENPDKSIEAVRERYTTKTSKVRKPSRSRKR